MIARLWRGRAADAAKADAYVRHFTGTVTAELKGLAGHRGAWLLRREVDGGDGVHRPDTLGIATVDRGLHRARHLEVGGRAGSARRAGRRSTTSRPTMRSRSPSH